MHAGVSNEDMASDAVSTYKTVMAEVIKGPSAEEIAKALWGEPLPFTFRLSDGCELTLKVRVSGTKKPAANKLGLPEEITGWVVGSDLFDLIRIEKETASLMMIVDVEGSGGGGYDPCMM